MTKNKFKWDEECKNRIPIPALNSIKEDNTMKMLQVQLSEYTRVFGRSDKTYPNGAGDKIKILVNQEQRTIEFRDPNVPGKVCVIPFENIVSFTYEE
jgi:hypothetical protein